MIRGFRLRFRLSQALLLVALVAIGISLAFAVHDAFQDRLSHTVMWLQFAPDGESLAATVYSDRSVQVYTPDPKVRAADCQMAFHLLRLKAPHGRWLVERIELPGRRVGFPIRQRASGPSIAYSPNGELLATAGIDGRVALWQLDSKKRIANLSTNDQPLCAIAFNSDGSDIIVGAYNGVHVWNTDQTEGERLWMGGRSVFAFSQSPDGRLLASTNDNGDVDLWSLQKGEHLTRLYEDGNAFRLSPVAFSPDGRHLVSAVGVWSDRDNRAEVKIWDIESRKEVGSFKTPHIAFSAAFSKDGKMLFVDDGVGNLIIRDFTTGNQRVINSDSWIRTVAVSPDGTTLATGDGKGTVTLWDFPAMRQLRQFDLSGAPSRPWLVPVICLFVWTVLWFWVVRKQKLSAIPTNKEA